MVTANQKTEIINKVDTFRVINNLRNLVKIPSYHGYEGPKADYVMREMERLGLEVSELILEAPDRRCILGVLLGKGNGRSLLFTAHMDSFWPPYLQESTAHRANVENGKIFGLGTGASYTPLAAALGVVHALKRSDVILNGDVKILATVDELGPKGGAQLAMDSNLQADMCIMGQSTNLDIGVVHTGKVEMEITTSAFAKSVLLAYAERSGVKSDNAVISMHKIMTHLFKMQKEDPYFQKTHPILPGKGAGLYIGSIIGGNTGYGDPTRPAGGADARNRGLASPGPAWCKLRVGARYWPGQTAEGFIDVINRCISTVQKNDPSVFASAETYLNGDNVPLEVPTDSEIVKYLQTNIKLIRNQDPKFVGNIFSTEGPFYSRKGIQQVAWCAPGGSDIGSPEEHVTIDDLMDTTKVYLACALDVCGNSV